METLKPVEHWFKRQAVRASNMLLRKGASDFDGINGKAIENVLFIRPEKLGDTVISFPVVDGLKRHYPNLKVSLLTSPASFPIVRSDPRFERLYLYRKKPLHDIRQLRAMRRARFDCVIDLICDDSVTALYLSQLIAPGRPRIGVGKTLYAPYYDFNYMYRNGEGGHVIDNTLKLLAAFNIETDGVSGFAPPYIDSVSRRQADELLTRLRSAHSPTTVFGYNLSAGKPNRVWPLEKTKELLLKILEYMDNCRILLFCMPDKRNDARILEAQLGERASLIPPGCSIVTAAALVSGLDMLITPDTSLVHIARSFRVPVVGLYPQFMRNFTLWRPYEQDGGVVVSRHDEIDSISVDDVYECFVRLCGVELKGASG